MTAEEFVDSLARRNIAIRIHPEGGFRITPPGAMTDADRAALKDVAVALERLLAERDRHRQAEREARRLAPADALMLREAQKKLGARLVEIRHPQPRHSSAVPLPEAGPITRPVPPPPPEQAPLFAAAREPEGEHPVEAAALGTPALDTVTLEVVRSCPKCRYPCRDPELVHCKNCGAVLESSPPPALDACPPDPAIDNPTPLTPEVDSAPPPPAEAAHTLVVSEPASCDEMEIFVAEVSIETTNDESLTESGPDTQLSSEAAPEVTSQATSAPRAVALVVDPEQDPVPPKALIASVNANDRTGQTSSRPRKTVYTAPVRHEISDDATPIAYGVALPAIKPARVQSARVAEPPDRSKRILLWITIERGRTVDGPGLQLQVAPSPSTDPQHVRFAVEELTHRSKLLAGARTLTRSGYRLTRRATRLRLCIEITPAGAKLG